MKLNKMIEIYSRTGKKVMKQVVERIPAFENGFSRGTYEIVLKMSDMKQNKKKEKSKG